MRWLGRRRLTASEAFDLELAGVQTGESVADLLPVTDLLRATARGMPQPTALRARRRELVARATAASRERQDAGRRVRVMRATVLAVAIVVMATAGGFAATLATSLLHRPPAPISRPAQLPPGDGQTPGPIGTAPATPVATPATTPEAPRTTPRTPVTTPGPVTTPVAPLPIVTPRLPADLAAELLAELREACGQQTVLPDLNGLDAAAAQARVDVLIAACELTPPTLP